MRKNWKSIVLCIGVLLPVLSGCVEDTLDVSGDKLNLDVNLGGNELIIPLGTGKKTLVSSILEPSDMLAFNGTGDYVIEESGTMASRDFSIQPVNLQLQSVSITQGINFNNVNVATRYVVNLSSFSGTINQTAKITASQRVPGALESLYSAQLDASKKPTITLHIGFKNVPANMTSLHFNDLKIQVPDFLKWGNDSDISGQILTLNTSFNPHDGYTRTIAIDGFDFSSFNSTIGLATTAISGTTDRLIAINTHNTFSVNGEIEGGPLTIDTNTLQDMQMVVTASFNQCTLNEVKAVVHPTISPVVTRIPISLSEDADFLQNAESQLTLTNPQIKLDLSNSSLLPISAVMNIRGEDKNQHTLTGANIPPIKVTLLPSTQQGTPRLTKIILSAKPVAVEGYANVVVPELPELTSQIPYVVMIEAVADVATDTPMQVDLDKDMHMGAAYDVSIPLAFDTANFSYTEVIDGLMDTLDGIADDILDPKWTITAQLVNTVPLDMQLIAEAVDTQGNVIDGLTVTTESDVMAGTLSSPTTSSVTVQVEAEGDQLSKLDAIKLHLHATSDDLVAGESLNGNQYIQFTQIKVHAAGGVHVDMND